jgi:hypothetical protein
MFRGYCGYGLGVLLGLTTAFAQSAVNVRDFGAKGDGQTDDTAALQAAIQAITGISAPYPGTAYYNEMQELYFPPGKYQISDCLRIGNGRFRGDGAVIEQTHPGRAIFVSDSAWRMTFSGFTFLGGAKHLVLHNPNLDTGQIHIEKCRFYGAKEVALDVDIVSTTLAIRDCIFLECRQVWINRGCDQAIMSDCWITTAAEMRHAAAIEHRGGRLILENLCGVPLVNGADQRWIDNYGANLTCRSVRFGGEGGGFTPIVNFAKYGPVWGPSILLEDCFICANGNARRNCAVYCEEVPNQIHLRDCLLAGASLIAVRPGLDLDHYFQASGPQVFSFTATGNTGINAGKLPERLVHPKVHPLPPKGLTAAQTRAALKRAAEAIRPHADENATGCESQGHRQQTEPGKFVELSPKTVRWHLNDFMDATAERNSEHLALLPVGTDVLLLRRTEARDNWPHVTIENVEVDLDRTPFLTWKQKPTGSDSPGTYAVRVLDLQSGTELLLEENWYGPWDAYRAFNLRQLLKVGGVRRLRLKYYYLGVKSVNKESIAAAPGDFIVLDFLRAESE